MDTLRRPHSKMLTLYTDYTCNRLSTIELNPGTIKEFRQNSPTNPNPNSKHLDWTNEHPSTSLILSRPLYPAHPRPTFRNQFQRIFWRSHHLLHPINTKPLRPSTQSLELLGEFSTHPFCHKHFHPQLSSKSTGVTLILQKDKTLLTPIAIELSESSARIFESTLKSIIDEDCDSNCLLPDFQFVNGHKDLVEHALRAFKTDILLSTNRKTSTTACFLDLRQPFKLS